MSMWRWRGLLGACHMPLQSHYNLQCKLHYTMLIWYQNVQINDMFHVQRYISTTPVNVQLREALEKLRYCTSKIMRNKIVVSNIDMSSFMRYSHSGLLIWIWLKTLNNWFWLAYFPGMLPNSCPPLPLHSTDIGQQVCSIFSSQSERKLRLLYTLFLPFKIVQIIMYPDIFLSYLKNFNFRWA